MAWPGGSHDAVELPLHQVDSSDTIDGLSVPATTVLDGNRKNEDEATTSGITDDATDDLQQRVIFVNHPQPQKFVNNRISTAKYRYTLYYIPRFIIFRCSIIKLSTH
nr:phospholipid-transporting ATPase IA-like isoform X2 [Danaus plexippus plexippus]